MLIDLSISNIVLIEKLNLQFGNGLNIMTGETGAGKSILLDALSLALGARSDIGLIRSGYDMATVTAEFDFVNDTAKEMALATASYNFDEVVEQLFAVFHFPVVGALVNGNHKPLLRSIHVFY